MTTAPVQREPVAAGPAEDDRLAVLDRYDLLDTPPDLNFDIIAELARNIFGAPTGFVSLIDGHRQWHKAAAGPARYAPELPRRESLCRLTITGTDVLIIADTLEDDRCKNSPLVLGPPYIRSYAGVPLRTPDGYNIGTVCVIDTKPRVPSPRDAAILSGLARLAMQTLELQQQVDVDVLTGASSRRAFKDRSNRLVALARRQRGHLSVVGFDLDHFKAINDTYGHAGGDRVLVTVAKSVAAQLRESDELGRLGGEEFAVVLPDTDAVAAMEVAEKLRRSIAALSFPGTFPPIRVSASFGISTLDPGTDDLDSLLSKADRALYEAKRQGRNRSVAWHAPAAVGRPQSQRRRVLKAASIIFNQRVAAIDCTVRALGDDGAEISIPGTADIPDEFNLRMRADNFEWPCRVTARRPGRLDVSFA